MRKGLILCLLLLLSACDFFDNSLQIKNQSKTRIAVEQSNVKDSISFNNIEYYLSNYCDPYSTLHLTQWGKKGAWKKYVNRGPEKKLYLYVFAVDTLSKYKGIKSMNDLYVENKYLKKIVLSNTQLDSLHWIVKFD